MLRLMKENFLLKFFYILGSFEQSHQANNQSFHHHAPCNRIFFVETDRHNQSFHHHATRFSLLTLTDTTNLSITMQPDFLCWHWRIQPIFPSPYNPIFFADTDRHNQSFHHHATRVFSSIYNKKNLWWKFSHLSIYNMPSARSTRLIWI